jgi:hypothetical protein
MAGQPVWLASVSHYNRHGLIATEKWRRYFQKIYGKVCQVLSGVGDSSRERLFRMTSTLCLHRATTDDEAAGMAKACDITNPGLAGGPVEILWSKGVAVSDSCKPCERFRRGVIDPRRPDLYIPVDCGKCVPCVARKTLCSS